MRVLGGCKRQAGCRTALSWVGALGCGGGGWGKAAGGAPCRGTAEGNVLGSPQPVLRWKWGQISACTHGLDVLSVHTGR